MTIRIRAALGALLTTLSATAAAHGPGENHAPPYQPPAYVEPRPMAPGQARVPAAFTHEAWLVDQSNSYGKAYGGTIHIYDGGALRANAAAAPAEVLDLSGETAALCLAQTGALPVRPHMLVFNSTDTHAVLAFVASGHVVFFDARTRQPLRCFRTEPGVAGVRQAHAVWPTPDDRYVLVANQNGKKFERIATDYATATFVQQPGATLNLATCTTPNGRPCQAPGLRPDNAPICPFVPSSGFPAYLSLRGGGMLAVDHRQTPMAIVAEYDADTIPRDGCGFVESQGWVYGNGGGGNALNLDGWYLYRVPVGGPETYAASNPPNSPLPDEIAHDERSNRDAHGVARVGHGKYVWFFDRLANVVEIYRADTGVYERTVSLADASLSTDPSPDLVGEAPDGRFVYASLRGPNPLSGDPHASTGSTPGLMVIEVLQDGRTLAVRGIARISNVDTAGVQRADGHAVRVRRK
jgi:hypothetical protein